MYRITVNNNFSNIDPIPEYLRETLIFKRLVYDRGEYTNRIVNIIHKNGRFMSGYLDRVLKNFNNTVQIIDHRIKPLNKIDLLNQCPINLSNEQKVILSTCILKERGIISVPPRFGKTYLAFSIINFYGLKTIYLCPTQSILIQTVNIFNEYFKANIGVFGSGKADDADIIFALPQTLSKYNIPCDLIIADECHLAPGNQYSKCILQSNAYYRYGLTATPVGRSDSRDYVIEGLLGAVIYQSDIKNYVGSLIPTIQVKVIDTSFIPNCEDYKSDFLAIEKACIVNCSQRNNLITSILLQQEQGKKILVIVHQLEHGLRLHNKLQSDIFVPFLCHLMEADLRYKTVQKFKEDKISILICSDAVSLGIEFGKVDIIILACGGKGIIRLIQRVGRGFSSSNKELVIYDFNDKHNNTTYRHYFARKKIYNKHQFYFLP